MAEWANGQGIQTGQGEPAIHGGRGSAGADQASAVAQGREVQAYGAVPGDRGQLVPASVESGKGEPGAVAQRAVGPMEEMRLWNFDTGSAELKAMHRETLLNLVIWGNLEGASVEIEGHASPVGEAEANQALSTARAEAVAGMLADVALASLTASGAGSADSPSPATADGARDRAVVIRILRARTGPGPTPMSNPKGRWLPGLGDLEHGFERRPTPPIRVLRLLQRKSEAYRDQAEDQGWIAPAIAAALTMGPSPSAFVRGPAGVAGDWAQNAGGLNISEGDEAIEAAMLDRAWVLHVADQARLGLGLNPKYEWVNLRGEVIGTDVHTAFLEAAYDPPVDALAPPDLSTPADEPNYEARRSR